MLPFLSWSDKQAVAERYRDGEGMPGIAADYGCVVSVIARALQQLGVERRSATEAAALAKQKHREDAVRRCQDCGAGCDPNAVRPLCPPCAAKYCEDCMAPLAHGGARKTGLCADCKCRARYKKRPPRLCRICGRMGARSSSRDLCAVHIGWFCRGCDQAIPPQRVIKYCTACEHDRKQRVWDKEGRTCSQCGEREAKQHATRCSHCIHAEYEVRRWASLHLDRPCRQCGRALARGRLLNYCLDCQRHRVRQRRREQQAVGAHRCAMCHDALPLTRGTYCGGCETMLAKWRKSWHAGNEVARLLGTVRTRRQWQKAGEEKV